ncbi:hypothetical protein G6K88_13880 [Agrobacterium rhizogenes]|uniref:hypothetical protein n=1 Tax=Rhizobium rhizogenes TaxID=359 RepID=UPI00115EAD37|nr:hypothetical protein [Rhizobium rhizogenes]NTI03109.1 hypothetical protein [Rhizobium rhizogenes]NTI09913.1 hypothetical protein [Rhizobium rhizogenes]TRB20258.1 hypothetical protein EXN70_26365 [Rhizobium rhizogenes]
MTETVRTRTPEHQHLLDARLREADLIKGVVHEYIVETRHLPFAERIDVVRRKEFATPYFAHLTGIERAFVISQTTMKISDVLWRIERQHQEAEDA